MKEKEELASQVLHLHDVINECHQERELWAGNFVERASQIQQMMDDASEYLQKAEWMTFPFQMPREILECIEFCKNMISRIKNMACNDDL